MPHCTVTLSCNAGVSIQTAGVTVWLDALSEPGETGFPALTSEQWRALQKCPAFQAPDAILYTHCHPDHYSRALTREALTRWPQARVLLPEPGLEGQIPIRGARGHLALGSLDVEFCRLPHDGRRYADVVQYGYLLTAGGVRILAPGDCPAGCPEAEPLVNGDPPDLALLNFPWITLPRGRRFLERCLPGTRLLIFHLPLAEDDRWGYRRAAEQACSRLPWHPDVRLLRAPLQQEELDLQ